MEVSHVKDHVTHAVIGGGENIGFGISSSAEFFNILSSTLYKNQKLAVVREVLCNAWDAHIAAGKQDTPVQITLSRDEFVIRDYGFGIPHVDIGPIYTVYGNSTKKHDGKQTGGFGLGCKAPFAYTDHFEVTSWAEGKKSLYNVSKSQAEVAGKPGMKLIVQTECGAETGLQVRIKLKPNDRGAFETLIQMIARNGEMNMELNHTKLGVIPFSQMSLDFLITTTDLTNQGDSIMLRYGNVIYPLGETTEFSEEWAAANKIVEELRGGNQYSYNRGPEYHLVLQAPPHSISVTPNREELSMQEHTIATVTKLLNAFVTRFHTNYGGEAHRLLDQCLAETWNSKNMNEFLTEEDRIPGNNVKHLSSDSHITTIPTLVRYHAARHYPTVNNYRKTALLKKVDTMLVNGWGNRGLLQAYRNFVQSETEESSYRSEGGAQWFQKHIVAPLTRGMDQNEMLDPRRLFVLGHGIRGGDARLSYSTSKTKEMIQGTAGLVSLPVVKYWPFLRNIVVLSYTRNDVADRLRRFPQIADTGGKMNYGLMLYIVPRNAARVEAVRKHFQSKHGVVFLDLTIAASWEQSSIVQPEIVTTPRRKKQKGWPSVLSILSPTHKSLVMDLARREEAARIEKPLWYTSLATKTKGGSEPQQLGRFDRSETKAVLELFGDTGAVSLSKITEAKLKAAGAVPMEDFVRDRITEEISNSERIGNYFSERAAVEAMGKDSEHLGMIVYSPFLRTVFGLPEGANKRDLMVIELWEDTANRYTYYGYSRDDVEGHKAVKELVKAIKELEPTPTVLGIIERIKASNLLEFLDVSYLSSAFNKSKDAGLINRALNLYLQALNN